MDKDFVYGSIIWGACIVAIICSLIGWGVTVTNNDHQFDIACINKGKQVQWNVKEGESSAYKECK